MIYLAFPVGLLALYAGLRLLSQSKKDTLGAFYTIFAWVIILSSLGYTICISVCGIRHCSVCNPCTPCNTCTQTNPGNSNGNVMGNPRSGLQIVFMDTIPWPHIGANNPMRLLKITYMLKDYKEVFDTIVWPGKNPPPPSSVYIIAHNNTKDDTIVWPGKNPPPPPISAK
jgi:hypothetical protein